MAMPMAQNEDADLLKAIAEERNHQAFEDLFARYEKKAFGLAYHLTGDREAAQDVVQEALVAVWKNAERFDSGRGTASKWILGIVANCALKNRKKHQRDKRRIGAEFPKAISSNKMAETAGSGHEELRRALAETLNALPMNERQVIALYFGAGLSQYEIARKLSLSQRTISSKMKKTLESLRMQLSRSGFAALTAEGLASELPTAIYGGLSLPGGFTARVFHALEVSDQAPKSAYKTPAGTLWLMALVAVVVAVGVGFRWHADPPENTSASTIVKRKTDVLRPAKASAQDLYQKKWVFNTPAPPEVFRVIRGSWNHVPPDQTNAIGYMINSKTVQLEFLLPPLRPPFMIRTRFGILKGQGDRMSVDQERFALTVGPSKNDTIEAGNILNSFPAYYFPHKNFQWQTAQNNFYQDIVEGLADGQRMSLTYRVTKSDAPLYMLLEGAHRIASIEIRELNPSDGELSYLAPYRAAVQAIPPSRRKGTQPLPSIRSALPGKPVLIRFESPHD